MFSCLAVHPPTYGKPLVSSFLLNGHTLRFHPHTQKLKPALHSKINNTTEKYLKLIFIIRDLSSYFVAPPEEQEGQSEEEQLKQKTKERARKEFLGAVAAEGEGISS